MADRDAALARIRRIPLITASVVIGLGVALLQAYIFDVMPQAPAALFVPSAQPLDAVLLLLTGVALLSHQVRFERLRLIPAGIAAALAFLLLAEYLFPLDLRLDSILFADQTVQLTRVFPGRPAPLGVRRTQHPRLRVGPAHPRAVRRADPLRLSRTCS